MEPHDDITDNEPENGIAGDEIESARRYIKERLGDLPEVLRCRCYRTNPTWCKGLVHTFEVDETFGIEQIKEFCGGGRYRLKFVDDSGKFVCDRELLIAGKPREDGLLLDDPLTAARKAAAQERRAMQEVDQRHVEQKNESAMIAMMQSQQAQFMGLVQALLTKEAPRPAPVPQSDPIGDILRYHQLFQTLGGVHQPAAAAPDETAHILGKLIDVIGKKQDTPPLLGAAALGGAIAQSANDPPLIEKITALDDRSIADLVSGVMERIGPDRCNALLNNFDSGGTVEDQEETGAPDDDGGDIPSQ